MANSLTDQLGRSNFVDSNGTCVGFKEYPDGSPLLWRVENRSFSDEKRNLSVSDFDRKGGIREFLDKRKSLFGFMSLCQMEEEGGITYAQIDLAPEVGPVDPCDVLYVLLSKPGDVYFTDFTMTTHDKKSLFGELGMIRTAVSKIRYDLNAILKDVSRLEGMVEDFEKEKCTK